MALLLSLVGITVIGVLWSLAGIVVGSALVLIGTNTTRQPLNLLPFYLFGVIAWIMWFIDGIRLMEFGFISITIVSTIGSLIAAYEVDKYYRNRVAND